MKLIYENNGIKYTRSLVETATEKTSQNLSIFLIFQSIFQATITFTNYFRYWFNYFNGFFCKIETTEIGTLRSMGHQTPDHEYDFWRNNSHLNNRSILGIISGILCINSIIPHISFNPYIPMVLRYHLTTS